MHEKVREFLEKKRQGGEKSAAEAQAKTLIRLGLWEKEYAPEDRPDSPAYPERDGPRRYRKVPVPVTEAEWAEIRKYAGRSKANRLAAALQILGGLCGAVGVLGLLNLFFYPDSRFLWLLLWVVLGTLCLGTAEIVNHLGE